MLDLDVGREDQDGGLGELRTDLPGRVQAFHGVTGWHPDIDHHQVRHVVADQHQELLAVTCLRHDLEARAIEQAGQALAEQDVVVGEDHP